MSTPVEIYRQLEEMFNTYEGRSIDQLISPRESVSNDQLNFNRGKVQAIRDFRKIVRSALAYDPSNI